MTRMDRIEIGGVARPHGIRGEVAIVTHDPDSSTLGEVDKIFVGEQEYAIANARATHRGWLVALEGVATRNDAERLQGAAVWVERSALALAPDDILLADLIGCEVRRADGAMWGVVAAIEASDYQDLLVIHHGHVERLLPLVDEFVTAIDTANRVITVDPPEGLPESPVADAVRSPGSR